MARPLLHQLVDHVHQNAHLAVLHGRDVLYLIEERAPGRPLLITDVGVRLPAVRTASGLAMLAALPRAQVRALFPDAAAFADPATGPATPTALRRLLTDVRNRGHATEEGSVTAGLSLGRPGRPRPHRLPGRGGRDHLRRGRRRSPRRSGGSSSAASTTAEALSRRLGFRG